MTQLSTISDNRNLVCHCLPLAVHQGLKCQLISYYTFIFQKAHLILIYILTLVFNLTWQFSQFVLLLQASVLFILATIQILNKDHVSHGFMTRQVSSLFVATLTPFYHFATSQY